MACQHTDVRPRWSRQQHRESAVLTVWKMNVLVTGAAGHLGQEFARVARARGLTIRGASRRSSPPDDTLEWVRCDLSSGEGIAEAVSGVEVILHAASDPRRSKVVDVQGTQRLVEAAKREGVTHVVFISIIGIDKIQLPYYNDKLEAERVIRDSGVPYTVLRTAQFHHFVDLLLRHAARVPFLLPIPSGFWIQSISTVEVAQILAELLTGNPRSVVPDLAGPERLSLRDAAERWLNVRGLRKWIAPVPVPGAVGTSLRAGHNTTPDRTGGRETWVEWLKAKYSSGEQQPGKRLQRSRHASPSDGADQSR